MNTETTALKPGTGGATLPNPADGGPDAILAKGPAADASGAWPDWFRQMRAEGWETFAALPAPSRNDERWRFANVKAYDFSAWREAAPASDADQSVILRRSLGLRADGDGSAGRMVFANEDLLARDLFAPDLERSGVIWLPLDAAAHQQDDLLRRHLLAQHVALGGAKFAALHKARLRCGTLLYVPPGVEVALPLEVFHWARGDGASIFPHTLVVAGERSRVTLVEYFESARPDETHFACGVNDLIVGAGAQVKYVSVQRWSDRSVAFQANATVVERDGRALSLGLHLGGGAVRTESASRLEGEGARSDMLSVTVADGAREIDQRTLQDHRKPGTASDLLYKNVLDDTARTIFAGLIRVEPGAHRTDAYQKVRNLLLSDTAEANSMPGLEIMADDVRCTHGATSGEIAPDELFYMRARGIPERVGRRLIAAGFLNETLMRLEEPALQRRLLEAVEARLARPR